MLIITPRVWPVEYRCVQTVYFEQELTVGCSLNHMRYSEYSSIGMTRMHSELVCFSVEIQELCSYRIILVYIDSALSPLPLIVDPSNLTTCKP